MPRLEVTQQRPAVRPPHCAGKSARAVPPHCRRRHWTPYHALDAVPLPCPSHAPYVPPPCPRRASLNQRRRSPDRGAMPFPSRSLDLSLICSRVLGGVRARSFLIDNRLERGSLQYLQCDGVRKPVVYSDQKSKPLVDAPQARDLTDGGSFPPPSLRPTPGRAGQGGTGGDEPGRRKLSSGRLCTSRPIIRNE